MAVDAPGVPFAAALPRRCWPVVALLLAMAALFGGSSAQAATTQTVQPPGPLLGTGDFISTSSRIVTATWEEYNSGLLYLWNTTYVTRAYSTRCTFSASAVCYKWIQYTWDPTDPYNDSLWGPIQRGCMVLGADPLAVGEADGISRTTDIYAAGTTYIPVLRPDEVDATLNPAAGGVAPSPGESALPTIWNYDSNCGGSGSATPVGCGSWAGAWSTSYGNMQLTQIGAAVTGAYDYDGGMISGTVSGNVLRGTWSEQPTYTAPNDAGDFQFTLSADGTAFSGQWRYGSAGDYSAWSGTRTCGGGSPGQPTGCAQYIVSGTWQTTQSNNYHITFTFSQSGTNVSGRASFSADEGARAGYSGAVSGPLSGTLLGNTLDFVVNMPPKLNGGLSRGHYTGTVSSGSVSGSARDDAVPNGPILSWSGSGTTSCAGSAPPGGGTPGASDITGVWDANNGVWTFTQSGSAVSAAIAFSGGQGSATLQGTISGGALQSTWQCNSDCAIPSSGGTVTLTVSSDGCTMNGTYVSVVDGMTTGTGPLTMTKRGC